MKVTLFHAAPFSQQIPSFSQQIPGFSLDSPSGEVTNWFISRSTDRSEQT